MDQSVGCRFCTNHPQNSSSQWGGLLTCVELVAQNVRMVVPLLDRISAAAVQITLKRPPVTGVGYRTLLLLLFLLLLLLLL